MNQTTIVESIFDINTCLHSITNSDSQAPLRVISLGYLTSVNSLDFSGAASYQQQGDLKFFRYIVCA